jgi:hypothetical protein
MNSTQLEIIKTIDLTHCSQDVKYHSRLIWQELFNEYVRLNCDLTKMDSLLCDLYTIERCLRERETFELYWYTDNHWTDTLVDYFHPNYLPGIKVTYQRHQITFERIESKQTRKT